MEGMQESDQTSNSFIRGLLILEEFLSDNSDYLYYLALALAAWSIYSVFLYTKRVQSQLNVGAIIEMIKAEKEKKSKIESQISRVECWLDLVRKFAKTLFLALSIFFTSLGLEWWFMVLLSEDIRAKIYSAKSIGKICLLSFSVLGIVALARIQLRKKFLGLLEHKFESDSHVEVLLESLIAEFGPDIRGELSDYIQEDLQKKNDLLKNKTKEMSTTLTKKKSKQAKVQQVFKFKESIIDKLLAYEFQVSLRGVQEAHSSLSKSHQDFGEGRRRGPSKSVSDFSQICGGIAIDRQYAVNLKKYFLFLESIGSEIRKRGGDQDEEISIEEVCNDLEEDVCEEVKQEVASQCRQVDFEKMVDDSSCQSERGKFEDVEALLSPKLEDASQAGGGFMRNRAVTTNNGKKELCLDGDIDINGPIKVIQDTLEQRQSNTTTEEGRKETNPEPPLECQAKVEDHSK